MSNASSAVAVPALMIFLFSNLELTFDLDRQPMENMKLDIVDVRCDLSQSDVKIMCLSPTSTSIAVRDESCGCWINAILFNYRYIVCK